MTVRGRPRSFDREHALQRAMEVFWEKGYVGASLSELKEAMGIEGPSLYAAFGSKEGLFHEAVARYVAVDGADIWAAVETAQTTREAIAGYLMATAQSFSRKDKPSGCLVVLSGLHGDEASKAIREDVLARRAANFTGLVERLQRGIEQGEIQPQADVRAIARFYIAVQQGMSIQARDGADRQALESIAQAALAAWPVLVGNSLP